MNHIKTVSRTKLPRFRDDPYYRMTFGLDLVKDHELALVYDGHSFV